LNGLGNEALLESKELAGGFISLASLPSLIIYLFPSICISSLPFPMLITHGSSQWGKMENMPTVQKVLYAMQARARTNREWR
jgi:hypothetical protein